jgi:two-component system heavy metal sensor histidine kinase CusS
MSFRFRTALTIAVLTAAALGAAFAAVSAAFNGLQRRQLDASLLEVAEQEALEAPTHGFRFSDRPGPAANDVGPLTKYGVIYDEHGSVLSATPPFDLAPPALRRLEHPLRAAFDWWFEGNDLRGVVVAIPGNPGKSLFLATSREDLDGDEAFLFHAMLVAFLVAVAWVSAVAYWMSGRLTRDHRAIAAVAQAVAAGNLDVRVRVESRDPEMERLGHDIDEMVVQLGELLLSHQRFIAHAAHELRSPLTALYGELQQALRKERDADGYRSAIVAALTATRRLKLLAEDLLTLARTRAERSDDEARIPLQSALDDASLTVEALAKEHEVVIKLGGDGCWVTDRNGDTSRLFRNLLENAIRYSPRGGAVRVDVSPGERFVAIAISDQGPGIDEAERGAVFEPFFRSRGPRRSDGAGLGLGIAREIARAHGGELELARTAAGARFVVSLPALTAPSTQQSARALARA